MRKLLFNTEIIILSILIWIILNESLSISTLFFGAVAGILSILVAKNIIMMDDYADIYKLKPLKMIKFFIYLIIQIYSSGISTIGKIISGRINPDIVEISTELSNDIEICILANSITLTPGTVTIDKKGNRLKVLWLDCVTKDSENAGELIKKRFEEILKCSGGC